MPVVFAQTPVTAEEFLTRGLRYSATGDYDSAIDDYTQAIRLNPNDVEALIARGIAYTDKDDFVKAIDDFEAVLRISPTNGIAVKYLDYLKSR